ncbi:hypothetical protein YC2023_066386 [Brassica napus]
MFVGVRQHTQDVRGYLWLFVSTHRTFVAVRVCPSAHTGLLWLSISTHISTLVLGLSTLAFPVDCSGDFGPCGLSVQYTQDVCGCPSTHTGRPCVSVSTHRTFVAVRVCLCEYVSTQRTSVAVHHTHRTSVGVRQQKHDVCGCLWLSVAVCQHTQDFRRLSVCVRVCPCVSFSTHRTSVGVRQHTQDVRACLWLSVAVRYNTHNVCGCPRVFVCVCVSVSTDRTPVGVRQHTHDSVQYTQDVCGCLPAHTGRPWLPVSTHRTSVAVRVCPSAHTGRPWLSISTHISTLVLEPSTLALPVDCSGDFGPRGLSVQYAQDVRWCPSAHTGHPCVSVSTHKTSVAVHVYLSAHIGCLWLSISTHISTLVLGLSTLILPVDCSGDFDPRGLFGQYTQDVRGCPPAHTGRPWLSVAFYGCPTHISALVLGLSTLALPVDCLGDFDPRGLSVQYTQDVRLCPPAHTGRPWLSVAVRPHTQDVHGCPCVSVCVRKHTQDVRGCPSVHISARCTHRTSVGVRQHTQDVRGTLVLELSTLTLPVDCLGDFRPRGLSVQYTHDVRGCPPSHKGCPCVSMCVHLCPSAHTGRPWLSISTHISTLVLGLSTLALSVDCLGDFGPRGLSVQYTQDVRGCPQAHTEHPWLSVAVRQHTQDVSGSPCVPISTHRTSMAVHQYTYQTAGPWTQHAGPSRDCLGDFGPHGLSVQYTQDVRGSPTHTTSVGCPCVSVCVRQHIQDVCECPPAHTGRQWLPVGTHRTSVAVRMCPSAHTGRPWLSISTHISTVIIGLSTLTLPVDCLGDFGPTGLSVQYTHDVRRLSMCVRVCPSAHTRRLWVYASTHRTSVAASRHTQDVRGCPYVSVRT